MAVAALRPCLHPGCRARVRRGRCEAHGGAATGWARHRGDLSSHARGYGAGWRRLRAQVLRDEPWCRQCRAAGHLVPATTVDHIKAKAHGGTDDRTNLQPLCGECHRRKTATEDRR